MSYDYADSYATLFLTQYDLELFKGLHIATKEKDERLPEELSKRYKPRLGDHA